MEDLSNAIRADVERLCGEGDRALGTERNRRATDYVMERLAGAGLEVSSIEFDVPEWCFGEARVGVAGLEVAPHPGPFSPPASGEGRLVVVQSADELAAVPHGAVLLLMGDIAETQFTPRDYPFYGDPAHAAILDALEAAQPLAVLAATTESAMTGAMSPFPLVEEVRFSVPSAYMTAVEGARLAEHAGGVATVSIDSRVVPSTGVQPIGRKAGSRAGRIVVSAHMDSKPETPGAIDNAAGVGVMLAVADLLRDASLSPAVEFVAFNGEDHALAPGEMAWLAGNDLSDVALAINIDAPGLKGGPAAYSLYGTDDRLRDAGERLSSEALIEGPQWPASDHMIFVMQGIPSVAITSNDFATASRGYSHTPADTPEILDYGVLSATARFVADLIRATG